MAIDTMKKGSIEMLTLFLLCEEDAYGYQLVQKIKERSKGFITVQEGSFYPLLYRLASLKKDYETVQQGIHNILDS